MRIAVASEKERITEHFGHCEGFYIYKVNDNDINSVELVPNPGHRPGFLPNYLNDLGIDVIISGGMGSGAIQIFKEKNIKVITGAKGNARQAVEDYLKGILKSTDAACNEHKHLKKVEINGIDNFRFASYIF